MATGGSRHRGFPQRAPAPGKVPRATVSFWGAHLLAVTAGETMADLCNGSVTATPVVAGLLVAVLCIELRLATHVPAVYWSTVLLLAVAGTLVADTLPNLLGVSLGRVAVSAGGALVLVISTWYTSERTVSVRAVTTPRREYFYWLTLLCSFALGTAVSDLAAQRLGLGYGGSATLFAAVILAVAIAGWLLRSAVATFWIVYLLTRPLGVALGDRLAQPRPSSGLGLGFLDTSTIVLAALLGLLALQTGGQHRHPPRGPAS